MTTLVRKIVLVLAAIATCSAALAQPAKPNILVIWGDDIVNLLPAHSLRRYSNAKMRLQSVFMLITVQPSFFASSYSACVKAPTLVSGNPCAGP